MRDKQVRREVREKIYRAFGRPVPHRERLNPPGTMGSTVDLPGKIDADYVKQIIREDFIPLARDCYEKALRRRSDLAGKLVVTFTIIGYEDVGAVVEGANVMDDESTMHDEELNRCIEEAMLSMAFDPPSRGGSVRVTYPFSFGPGEDDSQEGNGQ